MGCWLSRDPIAEVGGLNLYRFINNNVINLFDRKGLLSSVEISICETIAAGDMEHSKNKCKSNEKQHEKGDERRKRDKKGGEKGDKRRPY